MEIANNPNVEGMVETLAMDTIGTGPSLQLSLDDDAIAERIEDAFMDWAEEIDLGGKLLLGHRSSIESGEVFFRMFTNPALEDGVRLDVRVVESDMCTNPLSNPIRIGEVDGIEYDAVGNPIAYHFTKAHPGSGSPDSLITERVDAKYVIHLYRAKRPGQSRGCPEHAAALPLGAYERRYTLATVQAAETAANISAILETHANADVDVANVDQREQVPMPRGTVVYAPQGWKITQMKAEQPVQGFSDFIRQLLRSVSRSFKMPYSIAAGDSSGLNMASGRLEFQAYDKSIQVWRSIIVTKVLRRIFKAWLEEAVLVEGLLPQEFRQVGFRMPRATWLWTGRGHVDPLKEAAAQEKRLLNCTTTHTDELGREGKDFRKTMKRLARDRKFMQKLEIPLPGAKQAEPVDPNAPDEESQDDTGDAQKAPATRGGRRAA